MSRRDSGDPQIEELNVGEASEPEGRGTGECGRADSCLTTQHVKCLLFQHLTTGWHHSPTMDLSSLMRFKKEKKNHIIMFHMISSMTVETLCLCFL